MRYPTNLMKMIRSLINLKNLVKIKRLSRRRPRRQGKKELEQMDLTFEGVKDASEKVELFQGMEWAASELFKYLLKLTDGEARTIVRSI